MGMGDKAERGLIRILLCAAFEGVVARYIGERPGCDHN